MNADQKEKFAKRISEADINGQEKDLLLRRLKIASCAGVASIVRDFDAAMVKRRQEVCQSHRRFSQGLDPCPGFQNKRALILNTA